MSTAHFRFYEELNDFLAPERRKLEFEYSFERRASIKDTIEALGVPHTEVELILVNGRSVGFDYILADGDRVSVYPMFESLDVTPLLRLRPRPLRKPRFVLDAHLGTLARYLRLAGFDTLYRNDYEDAELAEISAYEHRVLLTRDRDLLKRKIVTHGYFVRAHEPRRQLEEVCGRLDLYRVIEPFKRCARCNGLLRTVDKAEVIDELEPKTRLYYERFLRCMDCGRIYWRGSHFRRMEGLIVGLMRGARA
jgi:uncharacterized protein with PIN domain